MKEQYENSMVLIMLLIVFVGIVSLSIHPVMAVYYTVLFIVMSGILVFTEWK